MARSLKMEVLVSAVLVAAALMIQSSSAQTIHVVGGAQGWTLPTANPASYSTWAASQTFTAGDILVFNFLNSVHDVAEVSKADYDACSTTSPISSATTSPANFTLTAPGEHYYICNFPGHCSAGQKLAINVTSATSTSPASSPSPAPQSSTPSPVSAPSPAPVSGSSPSPNSPVSAPSPAPVSGSSSSPNSPDSAPLPSPASSPGPSRSAVTYTVGDTAGWSLGPGAAGYQTWASNKNFMVGDILVFNYPNGAHDVAEVTKDAYGSCNVANPLSKESIPPTRITLTTPGEHFYTCTVPGHCAGGQKLAINVSDGSAAASPPPSTPSSPSPTGATTPPPPESSATSLGVSAATFLSVIFVGLLY